MIHICFGVFVLLLLPGVIGVSALSHYTALHFSLYNVPQAYMVALLVGTCLSDDLW